ncbi:MAG TPA: class I SAM-dependent methyltransferase, partial [archaeon]|nr:class I SAM-dependent methyltransferase [archaeon]
MAFPIWFEDKFGPHTIELYADEIRQTQLQLATIRDLIGTPPGGYPLLDLCCGWGRHAAPLYEMGYPVVGL